MAWSKRGKAPERLAVTSVEDIAAARAALTLKLRGNYGKWLLWLLVGQMVAADALMVAYAWVGKDWQIPASVMQTWLGATVVQLIGVVYVVVSHLFPKVGDDES